MTTPSQPSSRSILPWITLGAGLLLGYGICKVTTDQTGGGPLGNCIKSDSTMLSRNVTQQQCQTACPTCMWQGR